MADVVDKADNEGSSFLFLLPGYLMLLGEYWSTKCFFAHYLLL